VVYLSDWIVSPVSYPLDVSQRPILKAITPTASTNTIGILRDAIPDGEMGRAIISGCAIVDVLVNDSNHTYAVPISADSTRLGSATSGPARIIKWESSGSTRRAIVLLGDGSAGAEIIDLSGRTGSIADVTALQILRGVVSGTASAAVFTPDDASETLPGDWKAAATQTLAGGKTINRYTALTGPVVSIGNNGIGSTTDPSFYAEGAIFIGNAANGFNASHALAMYFDDTTGFSLIQHADSSGGTSIDMREALAGVSASGGVVSIGGTAPTFYCRVIQASLKFKAGAGAGADGVTGTGGGGDTVVGGIITALGSGPTITNLTYSGSQAATGDISPAQLVANTNDWNPTGW
jgi:hypothetical protein